MNINAYGGYYSSRDFYQQKADAKENPDTASTIGSKEMEAVLKEKDPELLGKIQGMTSKIWNGDSGYIGFSAEFKKSSEYVYEARKEMGVDFSETNSVSAKNEEKLSQKAQDFLKSLREKYGDYDFMIGNGIINKITITSDDNGNLKFFAELEKTSSKQKERLEKSREKKAEEKKLAERKINKKNPYEKDTIKRTTIEATSYNELLDKLEAFDWGKVADSKSGDRFDFSV